MAVKRIVANIGASDVQRAKAFYVDVLGLRIAMDQGWIMTFAADASAAPQISVASEGGSGTPVPRRNSRSNTDLGASLGACGASTCAILSGA